jgi:hypothetical protein
VRRDWAGGECPQAKDATSNMTKRKIIMHTNDKLKQNQSTN